MKSLWGLHGRLLVQWAHLFSVKSPSLSSCVYQRSARIEFSQQLKWNEKCPTMLSALQSPIAHRIISTSSEGLLVGPPIVRSAHSIGSHKGSKPQTGILEASIGLFLRAFGFAGWWFGRYLWRHIQRVSINFKSRYQSSLASLSNPLISEQSDRIQIDSLNPIAICEKYSHYSREWCNECA